MVFGDETMNKIDPKALLKRVKDKEKPERANVTFRLNKALMEAFKEACEDQEVTPTAVIEEFMASFIKNLKS